MLCKLSLLSAQSVLMQDVLPWHALMKAFLPVQAFISDEA